MDDTQGSGLAVLTPEERAELVQHNKIRDKLYRKEVTLAQAKALGYLEELEEPWGMSELRPDNE